MDAHPCPTCGNPRVKRNRISGGWRCSHCQKITWRAAHRKFPRDSMWWNARKRAKDKNLPFNLSKESIIIPDVCPVLGILLNVANKLVKDDSPTLDRIIPELGYVVGNVKVISLRANRIKNNATLEELEKIVVYVRSATT